MAEADVSSESVNSVTNDEAEDAGDINTKDEGTSVKSLSKQFAEMDKPDVSETEDNPESNSSRCKRQMKKDDSGISVEKSETSSDDDGHKRQKTEVDKDKAAEGENSYSFSKLKGRTKNRNYRRHHQENDSSEEADAEEEESKSDEAKVKGTLKTPEVGEERNSPDSGQHESSSGIEAFDVEMEESKDDCVDLVVKPKLKQTVKKQLHEREKKSGQHESSSEIEACDVEMEESKDDCSDSTDKMKLKQTMSKSLYAREKKSDSESDSDNKSETNVKDEEEDEQNLPPVLMKPKPKHRWFVMQEVCNRQRGFSTRHASNDLFRLRCYGSLHAVQRLELMYKMESHHGCVNSLHFNPTGTKLASGSDDLDIVIWDWSLGEKMFSYESGHRSNVFQAKFLPFAGDTHIVSCARDGQVRLAELSSTGVCRATRRLAQHRGPAHKLAIQNDTPHVFLSAGEDAVVYQIDVREGKPEKIVTVKEDEKKVALYSIQFNPLNCTEFCLGGRDHFIRIYDKRKITDCGVALKQFCPHHLLNSDIRANVTCAMYNYDGTEVLGTYNDEDIYLFDACGSDSNNYIRRYQGHRNNATVKGVNFFGPESQYIMSGSDCGNIFFWDKDNEGIVQWMAGDENGVVNCLEPHPKIPVIATSGLDEDVKIWVPSCEHEPKMIGLKSAVLNNRKDREDERRREPETIDGQMLWILWRHIRRTERRRRAGCTPGSGSGGRGGAEEEESSSSDDDTASDEDEASHRVQCPPS